MPPRALVFFPHNPYPPRSGAHQRGLAVLAALRSLGYALTFASADVSSEIPWTTAGRDYLAATFDAQVEVYRANRGDYRYIHYLREAYARLGRVAPVNSSLNTPPGLRWWFQRLFAATKSAVVLLNYAYWDGLLTRAMQRAAVTVVDTLDLISLHDRMRNAVTPLLPPPPISPANVPPAMLDEAFFDRLQLEADPSEYRAFDRYAHCLAVTATDAVRITAHTRRTQVSLVPITFPVQPVTTTYTGPAIFPTGPNPFNLQGYLYFVGRVLPLVRAAAPDFELHVTGTICSQLAPAPGIVLRGYVESLAQLYTEAAFMICPVLGKTGQQVKIVEAMAHGLPVVATRAAAEGSPIEHGVNGLVAQSAADLAEQVLRLWRDRDLCRRLGQQAHALIAAEFSTPQLARRLAPLLTTRSQRGRA